MNVTTSSLYTLNNVNYSDDDSSVRCSVAVSEFVVNRSDVSLYLCIQILSMCII